MVRITFIFLMIGVRAYAVPTLYPENFNRQLRNTTNSNVVADTKDSARFYVLPPIKSAATIQDLHTITANVGFCEEIANLQRYNADTIKVLNSLKVKSREAQRVLDADNLKLKNSEAAYLSFVKTHNVSELDALFTQEKQSKIKLTDLYDQLKQCVRDCGGISSSIEALKAKVQLLETERYQKTILVPDGTEFDQLADLYESAEENVADHEVDLHALQADLRDLYVDFNRMFDAHAQREGGRVSISYNSRWSENVERLNTDNPGLRFEKMPTKNAAIRAGAYAKTALLPGGAVLSFDVGGMSAGGMLTLESFPESFGGNAVLNLLAVCPLLHPDWYGMPSGTDVSKMSYPLTVSYEYPAAMAYEVTATYNMYRMYELVKTQGKSGGFFSSRSWSNQDEQTFFKDAFRVDWKFQDERKIFTEEQKLEINRDLLRQILSRLASFLAMNDSGTKIAAPEEAPQNGALVLSNSLNKTCPFNVYCQGAAIVTDVLNSIFGSSNTMQNLKRITNATMSDTYRSEQVVMQPMLSSFQ